MQSICNHPKLAKLFHPMFRSIEIKMKLLIMKSLPLALMALAMPAAEIEFFLLFCGDVPSRGTWLSEAFELTGITNRDPEV
jgi:hypothetical protein